MKKILCCLLCALFLTTVGCDTPDAVPTDTAVSEETLDTSCIYTIVRGEGCSDEEKSAAARFRNEMEAMGYSVVLTTDWVNRGEKIEDNRYPNEILIGTTNRPESENLTATLCLNTPDMLEYALSNDGGHYVAVASPGYMDDVVTALLAHFQMDETRLSTVPTEISIQKDHTFPLSDITIAGVSIADYDGILCPSTYTDAMMQDVYMMADSIFEACGIRLSVSKGKTDTVGQYIRFGAKMDASVQAGGEFCYGMVPSVDGLLLEGQDQWNDWCAMDVFSSMLAEQLTKGGTLSVDMPVYRISDPALDDRMGTFQIAAWVIGATNMTSEEQFRDIKECGFNQVILIAPTDAATQHHYAKWMAKYQLRGLWSDSATSLEGWDSRGEKLGKTTPYMNGSVTWGHVLRDEPNTTWFEKLATIQSAYLTELPNRIPYINLFPIYATNEQLQADSYDEYLTKYFEIIDPPYTSVDIYPLNIGKRIIDNYYVNLEKFSTACRDYDVPFGVYIQSVSFASSKRTPTEAEMRWQAYNALAFGAEGIEYFTYRTPDSTAEDFKNALIARDESKTERWYGAQNVNAALAVLATPYMDYNYLGSYGVNMNKAPSYFYFDNQYTDFDGIGQVEVTDGKTLLLGAFEAKEGDARAFVCVGAADPAVETEPVDVTVTLTEWTNVTLYQGTVVTKLTPVDGKITFTLTPGEGVFVTMEP